MAKHHQATRYDKVRRQELQTVVIDRLRRSGNSERLTMADLGEMVQCSQSFLSAVKDGGVFPSLPMLHRLARALGVTAGGASQSAGDQTAGRVTDRQQDP